MSPSSVRFGIFPDSFRGEGAFIATIDSGIYPTIAADRKPFVLLSIGNWSRTCTVRMGLGECAPAAEVLARIKALQIPVAAGMELQQSFTLHATDYHLEFTGGDMGVHNTLNYAGRENPIEAALVAAKEALRVCWQPTFDAVHPHRKHR
jgi:hypothetical protein